MVVCDRYLASSIAYGEAQGVDAAWLTEIQRLLPQPSLTHAARHSARRVADAQTGRRATSSSATCRCWVACAKATCGRRKQRGWVRLDGAPGQGRRDGGGAQRRAVTTRAAVSARTSFAPAAFNTRAHASSVAPVVDTSSTSTMTCRESGSGRRREDGTERAKASRTLRCRLRGQLDLRGRVNATRRSSGRTGRPSCRARSSAWLKPRARSRRGCSGTGTAHVGAA